MTGTFQLILLKKIISGAICGQRQIAAVNIGDRDIKDDVKAKKLRERSVFGIPIN